jgi:flagellar biogenesis protein FliO
MSHASRTNTLRMSLRAAVCCAVVALLPCSVFSQQAQVPEIEKRGLGSSGIARNPAEKSGDDAQPASPGSMFQTIIALAAVLALIGVFAAIIKVASKRSGGLLAALGPATRSPQGLVEVLARYPVAGGTQLVVLKFDQRVLLLCQSANKGFRSGVSMSTLCELDDPRDVASILLKTRNAEETSLAAKFQSMLAQEDDQYQVARTPAIAAEPPSRSATRTAKRATPAPVVDVEPTNARDSAIAIRQRLAAMRAPTRPGFGGVA